MKNLPLAIGSLISPVTIAAVLGIATICVTAAPTRAQEGVTEIVLSSGPDDTGTVRRLLDAFNAAHSGEIRVEWRQMARESDAHRRQLVDLLSSGSDEIDVMASDVIWTAEFARNRWVEDVTDRFRDSFEIDDLLPAPLGSATYRLRIWGIPWYTDAGMLFYRKDMLADSGFTEPPATWDELGRMARDVMKDSGTRYGFVFQGADYEGGAANAAEFIWSAGGEIVTSQVTVTGMVVNAVTETDSVQVGSDAAARGLDIARRLVADGVAPADVTNFREEQALDAFVAGDAVFLRSWPYVDGVLRQRGFESYQYGIAPLPAAAFGGRSASCLGGWNLMINANSSDAEQDAAWALIRYLTGTQQQKRQLREAGLLPILRALYEDPDFSSESPLIALGKQVFTSRLHARPMSPFYSEISSSLSSGFRRMLQGDLSAAEAAALLDREIRAIVVRNR